MQFFTRYWTRYLWRYPKVLLYMLQDTEYRFGRYLTWVHRTTDFRYVMKRRTLEVTPKVQLLVLALRVLAAAITVAIGVAIYCGVVWHDTTWFVIATGLFIVAPFILSHGIVFPLFIGYIVIQKPREQALVARASRILESHPGQRIAIAGSYGKTTAKEILKEVLSTGRHVAATPGNMNTAIGISRFVMTLKGDEDILVFELGEEQIGDVRRLARFVRPDIGMITGINEAHLASFKTLDNTAETILALSDFVGPENLYLNGESALVKKYDSSGGYYYDRNGVDGWRVENAHTAIDGTDFVLLRGRRKIPVHTSMIGLHTVGVVAASVAIADKIGLEAKHIQEGLNAMKPFEHRMQVRPLYGAWIIDDTYNGNSDGFAAGLEFLRSVDAKRRIYVTPGLVEQASKTEEVHIAIGKDIAVSADVVVLMKNSVTEYIKAGLKKGKFHGTLLEIDNPLDFYTNLDQYVATGDVVLMQNDWTDNYR